MNVRVHECTSAWKYCTCAWMYHCLNVPLYEPTSAWTYIPLHEGTYLRITVPVHERTFAWSTSAWKYICMNIPVWRVPVICEWTHLCINIHVYGHSLGWTYLCMKWPVHEQALQQLFLNFFFRIAFFSKNLTWLLTSPDFKAVGLYVKVGEVPIVRSSDLDLDLPTSDYDLFRHF